VLPRHDLFQILALRLAITMEGGVKASAHRGGSPSTTVKNETWAFVPSRSTRPYRPRRLLGAASSAAAIPTPPAPIPRSETWRLARTHGYFSDECHAAARFVQKRRGRLSDLFVVE